MRDVVEQELFERGISHFLPLIVIISKARLLAPQHLFVFIQIVIVVFLQVMVVLLLVLRVKVNFDTVVEL